MRFKSWNFFIRLYDSNHYLAPFRVATTGYRAFNHSWGLHQNPLNGRWPDVFAARNNHFVYAAVDTQEARGIDFT